MTEDTQVDAWDVLAHLGAWVDKSLVQAEGEGLPRYRRLETTRLFALERLIERGEAAATGQRHRDHFLALAEDMKAHLVGSEPGRRIAALDAERDNLFLALVSVGQEYRAVGRCDAMRRCADEALAVGRRLGDCQELARAIGLVAMWQAEVGDHDGAWASLHEQLGLWRRLDRAFGQAVVLLNLAGTAVERQRPADARQALVDLLPLLQRIDSRFASQNPVDVACIAAAATEAPALALRLHAASLCQREETHLPLRDLGQPHAARLAEARAVLGPAAAAEAAGRAMDHAQTLRLVERWLRG